MWAVGRGYPISVDDHGVVCTSLALKRWEVEPNAETISPLGAIILQRQPPAAELYRAIGFALEAHLSEIAGIEDGLLHAQPSTDWIKTPRRHLYLNGLQAGTWLRSMLVGKVCLKHGRMDPNHTLCPVCIAGDA
jgi:hypothetical protein